MTVKEHRKKVLEKLGFTKREGRKHEVWSYRTGKTHFSTSVSRNNRDIGKGLLTRKIHKKGSFPIQVIVLY